MWRTFPGEWRIHPQVVISIRCTFGQADVDLFATEENSHCLPSVPLCLPPCSPASTGHQSNLGRSTACAVLLVAPRWQNQPRISPASVSRSMARNAEEKHSLPGEGNDLAPPTGVVGPACLAPRWEPLGLHWEVMRTISEERAPYLS